MRPALRSVTSLVASLLAVLTSCQGGAVEPEAARPLRIEAVGPGPLAPLVAAAIEREAASRRRLVVYVGATWCEPCQAFKAAAHRGELDGELPGITLLEPDRDTDLDRLVAAGYDSKLVPLFALPRADGTASGRTVEGARKGSDYVAELAPRLRALVGEAR